MKPKFTIADRTIGLGHPTFIIAEMSGNHGQDFDRAGATVKAAKEAGADAIKLQTYTPDTITMDSDKEWFVVGGDKTPDDWKKKTLYELYKTSYTPWDWHPKLQALAKDMGLIFFSTPFDPTAVDFLEGLDVPCYKIASYEVTDIPLIKKVATTGKPVIMSVGFASLEEIELAVRTLRENGAKDIALLHCVTAYADEPELSSMNLRTIQDLAERFGVVSGFSDNNAGIEAPALASAMGASIIEKHFIGSRADGGPDTRFSLEAKEFADMVKRIRRDEQTMGSPKYGPSNAAEEYNTRYRKSLFVVKDVKKGEMFTPDNLRSIRPAFGLPSKHMEEILGKVASQDIERGSPMKWEYVVR